MKKLEKSTRLSLLYEIITEQMKAARVTSGVALRRLGGDTGNHGRPITRSRSDDSAVVVRVVGRAAVEHHDGVRRVFVVTGTGSYRRCRTGSGDCRWSVGQTAVAVGVVVDVGRRTRTIAVVIVVVVFAVDDDSHTGTVHRALKTREVSRRPADRRIGLRGRLRGPRGRLRQRCSVDGGRRRGRLDVDDDAGTARCRRRGGVVVCGVRGLRRRVPHARGPGPDLPRWGDGDKLGPRTRRRLGDGNATTGCRRRGGVVVCGVCGLRRRVPYPRGPGSSLPRRVDGGPRTRLGYGALSALGRSPSAAVEPIPHVRHALDARRAPDHLAAAHRPPLHRPGPARPCRTDHGRRPTEGQHPAAVLVGRRPVDAGRHQHGHTD